MAKKLLVRGHVDNNTGYGQHLCAIVEGMQKLGVEILLRPTSIDFDAPIPGFVTSSILREDPAVNKELLIHIPRFKPQTGNHVHRVHYTTWETTRLDPQWVSQLDGNAAVVVPCHWNLNCFSASGVTVPMHVVPEWVDTSVFNYKAMPTSGPIVFGCAGRLTHGATRKKLEKVIQAFRKAFPRQITDVELHVKVSEACNIPEDLADSRIKVFKGWMKQAELARWYHNLTCFVSASSSEGWGLHLHQAMACGRPLITALYAGVADYCNDTCAYPLDFRYVPAEKPYSGLGHWADVSVDSIVEAMWEVRQHRHMAATKGALSHQRAHHFSLENMASKLYAVLDKHRIFID